MLKPVTLAALIMVPAYLFLSNPGKVVVNQQGAVEGLMNQARAGIQGKTFWQVQRGLAMSEKVWLVQDSQDKDQPRLMSSKASPEQMQEAIEQLEGPARARVDELDRLIGVIDDRLAR